MKTNNLKLGIFFTGGLIILIVSLYMVGSRQNLFKSNITIHSHFTNALGLKEGSSVRFVGIPIGAVDQISIINDSMVHVTMKINKDHAEFIKKDASALITTDGLMGNQLVTIMPGGSLERPVLDGDTISTQKAVGVETVMSSVLENSRNLEVLTHSFIDITSRISSGEGLVGQLFFDSATSNRFESIIRSISESTHNLEMATLNVLDISNEITNENGTIGKLVYDDSIAQGVHTIMDSLKTASTNINKASREINSFTHSLNDGNGPLRRLVRDSIMAQNLDKAIANAKERSEELEETIELVNNGRILNLFSGNKKSKQKKQEEENNEVPKNTKNGTVVDAEQ